MADHNDGQEFNDDELQEIMGEIESLEQEFGDEPGASSKSDSGELDLEETERQLKELESTVEEEALEAQEEAVAEEVAVDEVHDDVEESVEEQEAVIEAQPEPEVAEEQAVDNVVAMDKAHSTGGNVVLGAEGSMCLDLAFQVAGKDAKLVINGDCLTVEMEGVHFQIDEQNGCVFEMPGGVRFQVPVQGKDDYSKAG